MNDVTQPRAGAIAAQLQLQAELCPEDFEYSARLRTCFRFDSRRVNWWQARHRCDADDAHLLTIESDREQLHINSIAASRKGERLSVTS